MKVQQINEKTRQIFLERQKRQEEIRHVEHTSATWNRIKSTQKIIARLFKTRKQVSGLQIGAGMSNRKVPSREKSTVIQAHEPDGTYTQNVQDINALSRYTNVVDATSAVTAKVKENPPIKRAQEGQSVSERTVALAYSRWRLAVGYLGLVN